MGKPTPVFKIIIWSLHTADTRFSLYIRKRDGVCQRCKSDGPLDNSHYWRRDLWPTRFDPRNCVALCRSCHTRWEKQQNEEYERFMRNRLGDVVYEELARLARSSIKRRDAIIGCMNLLSTSPLA